MSDSPDRSDAADAADAAPTPAAKPAENSGAPSGRREAEDWSNRRSSPRFDVGVQAEVFAGEDIVLATTKNLSLGGVGLAGERSLAAGSLVGLNLYLVVDGIEDAISPQLQIMGKVAWSTGGKGAFAAGVKFEDMDDERRAVVESFLKSLVPG